MKTNLIPLAGRRFCLRHLFVGQAAGLFIFIAGGGGALSAHAYEPWLAPKAASERSNPATLSPESIKRGRAIYEDRCSDCHGRKGRGDGSGAVDLERKPTDLTAGTIASQSDGALFWKISEGRRPMPGYGRKLSEEERWHVINFLRSLSSNAKNKPVAH